MWRAVGIKSVKHSCPLPQLLTILLLPQAKYLKAYKKNRIEFKIRLNRSLVKILWVLNRMHDAVSWQFLLSLFTFGA